MSQARTRTRRRALDLGGEKSRPMGYNRARTVARSSAGADDDSLIQVLRAAAQSMQIQDPFVDQFGRISDLSGLQIVEPPYNFAALLRLPRESNMLRQCIDAMVTNIEGHGWRLEYVGPEDDEDSPQSKSEKITLENLLDFPNDDHSLQELRDRVRRDFETLGNSYVEIGRDQQGRIVMCSHIPAHTVRMTNKDADNIEVTVTLPREGEASQQKVRKSFRRYVQVVGSQRIFFKEFGDPRAISPITGRQDDALSFEQSATELLHFKQYVPGTPYGVPRWINQLPSIMGSRQAELTNLDFFKENAIPAMALLVSGGMVTQSTLDDIEAQFAAARGRQSFNRILVIEAQGDEDAASQDGTIPVPKMTLTPLGNSRQSDALFQNYDKNNMEKVRSAFRLPPIFVGMSQDYTHATAKTSFEVAESQVFGPERVRSDDTWNSKVLATYNPQYWAIRSLPPRISDAEDIVAAISAFDQVGAMTANVAIGLANDFFDLEIPHIEAVWGDYPFATVMALMNQGYTPEGFEELIPELPDLPEPEPASPEPVDGVDDQPVVDQEVEGQGDPQPQIDPEAKQAVRALSMLHRISRARLMPPVVKTRTRTRRKAK